MKFNFKNIFPLLREALRPTMAEGVTLKTSSEDKKKIGATRKGATHKLGKHFLGRQILPMTPAQYRHQHIGNLVKAKYEKVKMSKREKWISA